MWTKGFMESIIESYHSKEISGGLGGDVKDVFVADTVVDMFL